MRDSAPPDNGAFASMPTRIGYGPSLLLGALLLPFAYATFFTFPIGDDFARAVLAHGLFDWIGGLHDMAWNWRNWSGRYTHHFLAVFLGDAVLTRAGYGALCLAVLALYGAAVYGIASEIAAGARRGDRLGLALAALAALCAGHRALDLTYYVATDALALGVGNALVLVHVWALCRLWHRPEPRRRDLAFAIGSAFLAIGCYEHSAIAAVVASALALWMAHRAGHPHRRAFLIVAAAAAAFCLLSFAAPGNYGRQRIRGVTHERIAAQLLGAGEDWLGIAAGALASHFALFAAFLGLAVAPRPRASLAPIPRGRLAAAAAIAFIAISAGIVLVHALSDVRVTDTRKLPASAQLLLGIVLAYFALACAGPLRTRAAALAGALSGTLPALLLFAVLAASSNTRLVLQSIGTGSLKMHAQEMERRLEVLASVQRADVAFAPLLACPYPACVGDPVPPSATAWPAAHIARLYGERSVTVEAPDPARAYAEATAAGGPLAWIRLPGTALEAAGAFVEAGPNATYRDAWLFVRAPAGTHPQAAATVAFRAPEALADTARRPRLVRIRDASSPLGQSADLYGAPLGIADASALSPVGLSVDGSAPVRVPLRAR